MFVHMLDMLVQSADILCFVFSSREVMGGDGRRYSALELLLIALDPGYMPWPDQCGWTQQELFDQLTGDNKEAALKGWLRLPLKRWTVYNAGANGERTPEKDYAFALAIGSRFRKLCNVDRLRDTLNANGDVLTKQLKDKHGQFITVNIHTITKHY